jgi:hypothetical protein
LRTQGLALLYGESIASITVYALGLGSTVGRTMKKDEENTASRKKKKPISEDSPAPQSREKIIEAV